MNKNGPKLWERHLGSICYLIVVAMLIASAVVLFRRPQSANDSHSNSHTKQTTTDCNTATEFRSFDPNTATYRELLDAGLPRNIAVALVRWRESGKIFRIKEDVALCYGMSDSLFFALEPYIIIGEEFKFKPREASTSSEERKGRGPTRRELKVELEPLSLDTVGVEYLTLLGFSTKEAELVLRYREIIGGYRSFEKFESCYAVDSVMAERLRPYVVFADKQDSEPAKLAERAPVNINTADSTTLCRITGIGPKSAKMIVKYRELLGGYYCVEQISELSVVTPENFAQILPQIFCDSAEIKKININFAASNELKTHPYLTSRMLKQIINKRVLKGGWSTIQEMIDDDIFTTEEAMRIAPYLYFGTSSE